MYIAVSVGSSDCNHYLLYPDKILSYIAHNARSGAPLKETSMLSSYRFWSRKCRSVTELSTRTRDRAERPPHPVLMHTRIQRRGRRASERPTDCSVNKGPKAQLQTETKMIFYSHNLTITVAASGRHVRGEWAFITLRVARCTPAPAPALDSSGPCSRTCTMFQASSFSVRR